MMRGSAWTEDRDRPHRTERAARRLPMAVALLLLAGVGWAPAARGALPPRAGGRLRIAAPTSAPSAGARGRSGDPVARAVVAATRTGLYAFGAAGSVVGDAEAPAVRPVLAAALPRRDGDDLLVPLVPDLRAPDGTPLPAERVAAALTRALAVPDARWLFPDGRPVVTVDGEPAGGPGDDGPTPGPSLRLVGTDLPPPDTLAARLAAAPLALDLDGAGAPFLRVDRRGVVRLRRNPYATLGGPWLDRIDIVFPSRRAEALRAFALGRLDVSWEGDRLYGREPVVPTAERPGPPVAAVLLLRDRSPRGALADDGRWALLGEHLDRRRLASVGLVADPRLAPGIEASSPPPAPRNAALPGRARITIPREDRFLAGLAEALAGILDERGMTLVVRRVPGARLSPDRVLADGDDLGLVVVPPPMPGPGAMVAAVLSRSGAPGAARRLVRAGGLEDPALVPRFARALDAIVLGRRGDVVSHRGDLRGVAFDALGRLDLAALRRGDDEGSAR